MLQEQQHEQWAGVGPALEAGQLDLAVTLLNSAMWAAAAQAGLVVDPATRPTGPPSPRPQRLSDTLRALKGQLCAARRDGNLSPTELQDLRDQWRAAWAEQRAKARQETRVRMARRLLAKPKSFWKRYATKPLQIAPVE